VPWIALTFGYALVHFLCYALVLRHLPRFTHERVIFAYHACSELALAIVLAIGAVGGVWPSEGLAGWLAALGIHGIYSLTFLSLWSLASGGYSIAILAQVAAVGDATALERADLTDIGEGKQTARLRGIEGLGLIHSDGEYVQTTRRGAMVATALAAIASLFAIRESG
jgi:hypothetical protein